MERVGRAAGLVIVLALVAAACGGGDSDETTTTSSSSTSSTSTTTTTTAPAPPASTTTTEPAINPICLVGQLNAQINELSPGAGQRYASITFTNSGTKPCQMLGFPGLGLVGNNAPSDDVRSNKPKVLITVPVGGQAYTIIHWTVVPSGNEPDDGPCQPTATQIRITPPNETNFLLQPWTFGPVCDGGAIDVDPMALGQPPQD
jgi:hypothetical protein